VNIYYINLDAATERRTSIEANLREFAGSEHQIHRVPAYDQAFVQTHNISGSLRATQKACILSHIKAIELSLNDAGPSLILEDDAIFGAHTASLLTQLANAFDERDIVFTDLCIPIASSMMRLYSLYRKFKQQVAIFNTQDFEFAGATAYTVNARSKEKLLDFFRSQKTLDLPYDIVLKMLIHNGTLTSGFVFPFITSVSPHSDVSQIPATSEEKIPLLWTAFRKLVFLESSTFFPHLQEEIEALSSVPADRNALAFSALCKLLASDEFVPVLR
jgi:GR25 family glycosyltransferase involved in LPS biosynthesis